MRFDIITIFPNIFDSYLNESILKRAREKKLVQIRMHDLRKWSRDKHKKVDDKAYGGGPGMVLQIEPVARAIKSLLRAAPRHARGVTSRPIKIVFLSPKGKQFDAKTAREWAKKYTRLILVAGRYEGVDERLKKIFPIEEISIGPYVLTGGELPAMVIIDAVARHIPGVLGKAESVEESRYGVGVPVYTRPEVFVWNGKKYRVPKVLLSGDHEKIDEWRRKQMREGA